MAGSLENTGKLRELIDKFQFVEFKKFNMKCEIERMEINYTFYSFCLF